MAPSILVCSMMHSAVNALLILLLHRTCYSIVSGNISGPQVLLLLLEIHGFWCSRRNFRGRYDPFCESGKACDM